MVDEAPPGVAAAPSPSPTEAVAPPAPGPAPSAPASAPPAPGSRQEKELLVKKALKKIFDPEIPMNIVDLGLIYGYDWADDQHLKIRMTMTGPGCPVAGILAEEVQNAAAAAAKDVAEVKVEVVWDPPWGPEKMSDFAKRQFGYL